VIGLNEVHFGFKKQNGPFLRKRTQHKKAPSAFPTSGPFCTYGAFFA
jgi:hypothetical protein